MRGRLIVVAAIAGISYVHGLSGLPSLVHAAAGLGLSALATLAALRLRWRFCARLALLLLGFYGGLAWATYSAGQRLSEKLAPENVDLVSRVVLRVQGLPVLHADRRSFHAEVLQAQPSGVPKNILVNWSAPGWRSPYSAARAPAEPFPELRAGQIWRMALVLRPVQGAQNFAAFDYEDYAFAAGVRALATVRGEPELIGSEDWASIGVVAARARHALRESMAPFLQDKPYGPVLRALAIGDQDGVANEHWEVFNRSGITHLVSISGSHITMLSGLAALLTYFCWCRIVWRGRVLAERLPARRVAALAAVLTAWLYCLLAGWGVPAQRTFMMLAVAASGHILGLRISGARILALAAVLVLALDPWALRASGFWLSFLAVAVLLAVGADNNPPAVTTAPTPTAPSVPVALATPATPSANDKPSAKTRVLRALRAAAWLQWAVSLALAPLLAYLFHEVSLISPLANAYAIAMVELLITPLSLLLAALSLWQWAAPLAHWVAWFAHAALELMMRPTEWLASLPTWRIAAGPAWIYAVALLGAALALWPGRRHRVWAWLGFIPMLLWRAPQPPPGYWQMHAIDVGQGSALLIRTARHALLFDSGARRNPDSDEGARSVVPLLKALGIGKLDALVVSHADLDHAGGTRSVLQALPVAQSFSSFDLAAWLRNDARKLGAAPAPLPLALGSCLFGARWQMDGVVFEFLWPLDERAKRPGAQSNAASCVLRVRGARHSVLLTGDIDAGTEAALVDRGLTPADVVVAAHHGSRSSSSQVFVQATAARHVLMQLGRWNRHGHPNGAVLRRWQQAGAQVWRSDLHGAVVLRSTATGLEVQSELLSRCRYWHDRCAKPPD